MTKCLPLVATAIVLLCSTSAAGNRITDENSLAGTTAWQIPNTSTVLAHEIEGYASTTSVNVGDWIYFHVSSSLATESNPTIYTLQVFRMGWYGGLGGRAMTAPIENRQAFNQGVPLPDSDRLVKCDWPVSDSLQIPSTWVSGVYLAKISAVASGKASYILFVVREDSSQASFLYSLAVTTYQAYNNWGGKSYYGNSTREAGDTSDDDDDVESKGESNKVSFDRPYGNYSDPDKLCPDGGLCPEDPTSQYYVFKQGAGRFFDWDFPMVRWLERNGYDVTYATGVDLDRDPNQVLTRRAVLFVGHDEYWSQKMRSNVEAGLDAGVNIGSFSGNTLWGKVELDADADAGPRDMTLRGYYHLADGGTEREDALLGIMTVDTDTYASGLDLIVTNTSLWPFKNSGLSDGHSVKGIWGYEVEGVCKSDLHPNLVRLGHTPTVPNSDLVPGVNSICADNGNYGDTTLYTASSGAAVFAAGTIHWSYGLDDHSGGLWEDSPGIFSRREDRMSGTPVENVAGFQGRTLTANILARLAVPPLSLNSRLGAASPVPGRIDLFAKGSTGTLWTQTYDSSTGPHGSAWVPITGININSGVAATSSDAGQLDVFATNLIDEIVYYTSTGGSWIGPTPLYTSSVDAPAAVSWGSGRIDIFYHKFNGDIGTRWFNGSWQSEFNLGHPSIGALGAPAATSSGVGRLDVFIRGADNALYHKRYSGGSWSGSWSNLGGQLYSSPAAVSRAGRLEVFYRGDDETLRSIWYDEARQEWQYHVTLAGGMSADPAVSVLSSGQLDAFFVDEANIVRRWTHSSGWSGPDWLSAHPAVLPVASD